MSTTVSKTWRDLYTATISMLIAIPERVQHLTRFDLTDWQIFIDDCNGDGNKLTDIVTSYMVFCRDLHILRKQIKIYGNNKPWMTPNLRKAVIDKHKAFGTAEFPALQKMLNEQIRVAKANYNKKISSKATKCMMPGGVLRL